MKKLFSLAIAVVLLAVMTVNISAADIQFKAAKGTAVIDCQKDDAYLAADEVPIAFGATADSATGKLWAIWDDTALYFYGEITDATPSSAKHASDSVWERDSLEVYVDFTNAHEDSDILTINAGQYTAGLPYTNGEFWGGYGLHQSTYKDQCSFKTKLTDGGWIVEMKIVYGSDFKPAVGAVIGFTAAVNDDSDDADGRETQVMVSEGQTNAWSTTGAWYDRLVFSDAVYAPPPPETEAAAPTDDAAPAVTAAQTSDISLIAVFVSAVTAAGVVAFKKKR